MEVTVKELVKQNNDKRKNLTAENQEYYENMLVFIRTNALKSERAAEEVLLEMLDHLIEAQREGKNAEDVFGKSPKELAEEIIETLPKETFKKTFDFVLETGFNFLGWYLVVAGSLPLITQKDQTLYLGSLLLSGMLLIAGVVTLLFILFGTLKRTAFEDRKRKNRVNWLLSFLFVVFIIGGVSANFLFDAFGPTITISYLLEFGLGCFLILAAYLFKKSRESK